MNDAQQGKPVTIEIEGHVYNQAELVAALLNIYTQALQVRRLLKAA